MRPPARAGLAATAVSAVLAAGALPAFAATPAAGGGPDHAGAGGGTAATSITLVTGDVVHVTPTPSGRPAVQVDPAPGTDGPEQTFEIGGDLYVVPAVAQPFLASGALDQQLFNVTELVEDGYGEREGLPVIAQYDQRLRAKPATLAGSVKTLDLPSIDGAALVADTDEAADFWAALTAPTGARTASVPGTFSGGVTKLWLDGHVTGTLDVSVPLVGAPEAWAAGADGAGAKVAVLDTGVDVEHPDLADVVTATRSFVPGETAVDGHGHGTHVSSTVAGSGAASDGRYQGVAPGAEVVVGKVLSDDNYGLDSWIIAGMEWAAVTEGADVVSMSLGDDSRTDQTDPIAQSLNALSSQTDALFVVAAGNSGAAGTINSPGTADAALTVAATDDADALAPFSSRGPRGLDDGLKPDIAAPGVDITAARSQFSSGSGSYKTLSGTSMATPHVAGAAAILAGAHPEWGAQRIKDALMSSSVELDHSLFEVGDGRLDIPAALDGVDATGSLSFGRAAWGDADPEPATRTVTYSNDTDADVELDLTSTTEGPDGDVDLVHLAADRVVVPAHGTADVDLTVSFADAPSVGHYLGQVVARDASGQVVARTGTGLTREDERYDLDVTVIGPDGHGTAATVSGYEYGTTGFTGMATDPETGATKTQRVAPGVFSLSTTVRVADTDGTDRIFWLNAPHVAVEDHDVHVVLDAREANPVELDTPRASVDYSRRVEIFHDSGVGGDFATLTASIVPAPGTELWTNPSGEVAGDRLAFTSRWTRTAPLLDLRAKTPGSVRLDATYQRGSSRLDGKIRLDVAVAGTGTPAEIAAADVAGKAVLVTNSAEVTPAARATAAQEAGAALLVVIDDGPGRLVDAAGGTALPVVSVPADQGARLLAAPPSKLRITGTATGFPDYGYDVAHTWTDEVPTDVRVAPRAKDLVAVTDRMADPDPRLVFLSRYDCPTYRTACLGGAEPRETGSQHVTYLSAPGETSSWYAVLQSATGWELRDDQRRYAAGEATTIDWFGVVAPHQGPGFWMSNATGRTFRVNVPAASSSGELTGTDSAHRSVTSRLYQDDVLLRTVGSSAVQGSVPEATGAHTYRLEMDTVTAPEVWASSSSTSTAWTFRYDQAQPAGLLPLISLGYDVPTDLAGTVRAHRTEIGITARHEDGAVGAGSISGLSVEVSYDEGATWQPVTARRGHGGWTVQVDPPRQASSVSLRTEAHDDAGSSVTQEVVRAFGVR